ncbi:MAG: hypothetical protein ACRC28_06190 [Clostridium sp.]|uniref:hypothetical protein n=1 Tax=Clostridia TaxID=186801 RepID=UPI003F2F9E4F
MNSQSIAIELICSYLNNPSYYSKSYIINNFQVVIQLLSKEIDDYLDINSNIKQESLGSESVTYVTRDLSELIKKFKVLLPNPRVRCGVVYC